MFLLIVYLSLALGASFLCSLLEAVILSVTHSHVGMLLKRKQPGAKLLKVRKDKIDQSLSAILTVNTISHTVGAAGVGAQVSKIYEDQYLGIASAILTILILVFSEIIPKTLGASNWRRLSVFTANIIQGLIVMTYPLVLAFEVLAKFISKSDHIHPKVTREEMILVAEMGQNEGTLLEKETRVIRNLLRLNNFFVRDVMTPFSVVFSLEKSKRVEDVVDLMEHTIFSRIPVFDGEPRNIVGVVFRLNILEEASDDEDHTQIGELMKDIHVVNEEDSVASCLDLFILRREHMFLVRDKKGVTVGIITLEDAIETLLGVEIVDEVDTIVDMRQLARERREKLMKAGKKVSGSH